MKVKHLWVLPWLLGISWVSGAFAQDTAPGPVQRQLREVYKELVEINTTDSAGSCTEIGRAHV